MTSVELLPLIVLLDQLVEQVRSGFVLPAELKASWYELERRLLLGLRAEERAAARTDTGPLAELKAIAANEAIRNLVWEMSLALEFRSSRLGAMQELAKLLRARAKASAELPQARHTAA